MKTDRNLEHATDLYHALDRFRETSLRGLRSSFLAPSDPDVEMVWTETSSSELVHKFIERPDAGKRSFTEKLRDQLADVSRPAGQLLEELTWLHLVIARKQRYESKRRLLDEIAEISGATGPSGVFDDALHTGLVAPGTSFFTRRPNQLWLLVRFADRWTTASAIKREEWLSDPLSFRAMVFDLDGIADQTQRHALLHLVHPDYFEDTVSQYHKRDIAAIAEPDEVDENDDLTIANIRRRLSPELGERFSFYGPEARRLWQPPESEGASMADDAADAFAQEPPSEGPDDDRLVNLQPSARGAWLIRGSGGERVPEWLTRGVCGIGFADAFPFPLTPGVTRDELRAMSYDAGADTSSGGYAAELGQVWRFVNKVEIGDYVVTVNGQDVYLGVVDSPPRDLRARTRKETVRSVEWLNADQPVQRRDIAKSLQAKMKTLLTLTLITSEIDELERWISRANEGDATDLPTEPTASLARATPQLDSDLLLTETWLNEVIELLEEKKQIILHGPPGTGKTFLAQSLADHFSDGGGTSELVQFHPSYTYEDFFEGYRPAPGESGKVDFQIKPGPLRRIAEAAAGAPGTPHVLIIDEINRANLAKVFGELYFLLEYRDRPITLQYSDLEFMLPPNLFIIGTMNTADRSIALVDAAMRRRFYFVEMVPSAPPIDSLLARWLAERSISIEPALLLAELNRRLEDPDAAIGPSYFMTTDIMQPGRLERIWSHAILPLLEERFYGSGETLTRYALPAVRAAIAAPEE